MNMHIRELIDEVENVDKYIKKNINKCIDIIHSKPEWLNTELLGASLPNLEFLYIVRDIAKHVYIDDEAVGTLLNEMFIAIVKPQLDYECLALNGKLLPNKEELDKSKINIFDSSYNYEYLESSFKLLAKKEKLRKLTTILELFPIFNEYLKSLHIKESILDILIEDNKDMNSKIHDINQLICNRESDIGIVEESSYYTIATEIEKIREELEIDQGRKISRKHKDFTPLHELPITHNRYSIVGHDKRNLVAFNYRFFLFTITHARLIEFCFLLLNEITKLNIEEQKRSINVLSTILFDIRNLHRVLAQYKQIDKLVNNTNSYIYDSQALRLNEYKTLDVTKLLAITDKEKDNMERLLKLLFRTCSVMTGELNVNQIINTRLIINFFYLLQDISNTIDIKDITEAYNEDQLIIEYASFFSNKELDFNHLISSEAKTHEINYKNSIKVILSKFHDFNQLLIDTNNIDNFCNILVDNPATSMRDKKELLDRIINNLCFILITKNEKSSSYSKNRLMDDYKCLLFVLTHGYFINEYIEILKMYDLSSTKEVKIDYKRLFYTKVKTFFDKKFT